MKRNLLNRKNYKEVKKMDRQEMENFVIGIYNLGFQDGKQSHEKVNFKMNLIEVLDNTKGVGVKTKEKILKTLEDMS